MAFLDKLNQVAKNIGDRTSDAIETSRLNSKINAERAAAMEDLRKIGEYYYDLFMSEGVCATEIAELCQSVKGHYDAVAEAQAEIEKIKAEAAAPAPAPAPAAGGIACPSCGVVNDEGTKFCKNCGTKLEAPAQPRVCPACGKTVEPGVNFCPECGQKIDA